MRLVVDAILYVLSTRFAWAHLPRRQLPNGASKSLSPKRLLVDPSKSADATDDGCGWVKAAKPDPAPSRYNCRPPDPPRGPQSPS